MNFSSLVELFFVFSFLFFFYFCSSLSILELLAFNGDNIFILYTYILVDSLLLFFAAFSSLRMFYTWSISNSAVFFFSSVRSCVLSRIFNSNQAVESDAKGKLMFVYQPHIKHNHEHHVYFSDFSLHLCIYICVSRKHLTQIYNTMIH